MLMFGKKIGLLLLVLFCAGAAFGQTPRTAAEFAGRGHTYYNNGDYAGSIPDYSQAIKLEPRNAVYYFYRGNAYLNSGDYAKAIADYNQAIKLDPRNPQYYAYRAESYSFSGDDAKCIADYTQAIKLDPENDKLTDRNYYIRRGDSYFNLKQYDKAIEDFKVANSGRFDPFNAGWQCKLAQAYMMKGDLDNAISWCNNALKVEPDYAQAYAIRATCYLVKDNYRAARADVNKLLRALPNDDIVKQLDAVLKQQGY